VPFTVQKYKDAVK